MLWSLVGSSNPVEVASGNITLGIPSGVRQGDLLIACISFRDVTGFSTSPTSPWVFVSQQNSGNTTNNTTNSVASSYIAYCIRGESDPTGLFNRSNGSRALGQIIAYRGVLQNNPIIASVGTTMASGGTAISGSGITTDSANSLVVAALALARNATVTTVNATNPGTSSGTNSAQTGAPSAGTWQERSDNSSATSPTQGLVIADAIRSVAGATGNITATASASARHVVLVAGFRLSPAEDLVANRLSTNTFTVSTPQLNQNHAFVAGSLSTGIFTLNTPQLRQSQSLTPISLNTGIFALSIPQLTLAHSLVLQNLALGAFNLEQFAIGNTVSNILKSTGDILLRLSSRRKL